MSKPLEITVVGCGDAFGSGGRLNTCFHVEAAEATFLVDCGATAMPGLKRLEIDRNAIGFILVTHFHADHFGGIPPFVLDAQFFAKRTAPLTIAGPAGLKTWFARAMDTAFPGSAAATRKFEVNLIELAPAIRTEIEGVCVTPRLVRHGEPEGPFFSYRIECSSKVLAYTGDTEWTETLIDTGRDCDLLIAEAYFYDKKVPLHLDYATLKENLPRMAPKRVLLTHMNEDMLARVHQVPEEKANDGLVLTI